VSHTCEATFGVPGRGGARESRKRGVATDARGLPAFQVLGGWPTLARPAPVAAHHDITAFAVHARRGRPEGSPVSDGCPARMTRMLCRPFP
jgi:hypothetical protein